ncbi:LytTR family DNA-binding domain-containing protein [Companilactobacillus farciminis]|uniref:LytTR family DNA-binding domain-containing protein n=1 Tax=Companilactobacillus farciminis TaxID=1612 RepID=UPI00232E8494|nr:LytTR family DNA-binding domain-containing protein [Companilactobacillus farciminis]WCG35467.1 LytTR family DNA-binding domain-containing protein [Companilactobacillus farciminis]
MKIRLDISSEYREKEVIIRANKKDEEVAEILRNLQEIDTKLHNINGYLDNTVYSLSTQDILFFETNDRNVYAHTKDNAFLIHYRLYELEENLSDNFLRVSKSSILNVDEVKSLTQSVMGNLIQFRDSYKQIYVSRRFLKKLKLKLNQRKV